MKKIRLIIFCSIVCMIFSNKTHSQTWSSGSSKLYANPTSTKVGIGTTSPISPLHVQKSLYGPTGEEYRAVIYGYNTSTETSYKNPIGLLGKVNGQNGMAVYGWNLNSGGYGGYFVGKGYFSGNVGIGTTSPSEELHVKGDILADGGWVRVDGQKGLYFNSYGGGFYMTDNTWIRTYNDKSFYHNSGTMRTDGTFQVGPNGDRFIVNTNGNIGIAKTSPSYKLDVNGSINFTGQLLYNGSPVDFSSGGGDSYWEAVTGGIYYDGGNVGIGTDNPEGNLEIQGEFPSLVLRDKHYDDDEAVWINEYFILQTINKDFQITYKDIYSDADAYTVLGVSEIGNVGIGTRNPSEKLTVDGNLDVWGNIYSNGNVGIGTYNPDTKLTVKGEIKASKVRVVELSEIPDYVFKPEYELRTVEELEEYVTTQNHLPEIPNEEELKENGMDMGEFQLLLLKKIEEQALYIIELNKKIESLQKQMEEK